MSDKKTQPERSSAIEPAEVEVGHRHRNALGGGAQPKEGGVDDDGIEQSIYVGMGLMSKDTTDDSWGSSVWQRNQERSRKAAAKVSLDRTRAASEMPNLRDPEAEGYYFLTEEEEVSSQTYAAIAAGMFAATLVIG